MRVHKCNFASTLLLSLAVITACSSKPDKAANTGSANATSNSTPNGEQVNLTGTYRYKTARYNNEFTIQQLEANQLKVQFSGTTEYKAGGELMADASGTAPQVVALDAATKTMGVLVPEGADEECRITLKFAGTNLTVEQEGACGFAAKVSAAGTYAKNSATAEFKSAEDAATNPPADDAGQRLRFARGAYATSVTGSVKHDQELTYLIDARAGQTIELKATTDSPNNDVVFHLVGPGGVKPMSDPKDEAGGYDSEWKGRLPRNGTYKIVVGTIESPNANFKLTVAIR